MLGSIFLSCNNSSDSFVKTEDSSSPEPTTKTENNVSGCYRTVTGRDTVELTIKQSGSSVKGALRFDNYEKDSSHGTVDGSIKGDTLVLWYDFNSEGMHSVMEIVLHKKGNNLLRAIGPIINKGDTALFKDHTQLSFDEKLTLQKINCNDIKNQMP